MKIKMLKTAASAAGVLSAGETYDVALELGQQLVMADAAEWLEAPAPQKPRKAPPAVQKAEVAPKAEKAVGRRRRAAKGA